jgi:hypothetical protein
MPLLDDAKVENLLAMASIHRPCNECGQHAAMDYCRSCDEFYWIHAPGCVLHADHYGHRLTIVPFVENRDGARVSDRHCLFFANGVTAVFRDGQQQPMLQQSWLELFAEFLEARGQDPAAFRLVMPDGQKARFQRAMDGWSWRFE